MDFRRENLHIKDILSVNNIDLGDDEYIAGGFVRDIIYDKPYRDLDIYYTPGSYLQVNVLGSKEKDYVKYGDVYIDFKPATNPRLTIGRFMMSIDQAYYSKNRGVVVSNAFKKTMETGIVVQDDNIPNWNGKDDGRPANFHIMKLKNKYPEMEFLSRDEYNRTTYTPVSHYNGS